MAPAQLPSYRVSEKPGYGGRVVAAYTSCDNVPAVSGTIIIQRTMLFEPVSEADFPLIESMLSDPRMMEHLGGVLSPEQIKESHARQLLAVRQGGWCFRITPEQSPSAAGTVMIWNSTWRDEPIHEMGWMIRPEFQGQGIASAAVAELLCRARSQSKLDVVHAFPAVANRASNRICEKNGFRRLEECDIHYKDRPLRCVHWCVDVAAGEP